MGDMRPKIQQLSWPFQRKVRGEAPTASGEGTESSAAKRQPESPAVSESLMEEICRARESRRSVEREFGPTRGLRASTG